MSLNIKNETTHRLVRELAARTGQSQTSAVEDAVRRRLAELDRQTRAERIREVVEEMRQVARSNPEWMATDWDRWLYDDETGLPR